MRTVRPFLIAIAIGFLAAQALYVGGALGAQIVVNAPVTLSACPTGQAYGYDVASNTLACASVGTAPTPTPTPAPTPVPTPTPTPVGYCGSGDQVITVPWPATGQVRPSTSGFGAGVVAFKVTVPTVFPRPLNITHMGFMHIAEVPGQAVTSRDLTVSRIPCDFQSEQYLYSAIGTGDTAPGANFMVNQPNWKGYGANLGINSGDVVYVNVRNTSNGGTPSCPNSACNVLFDFATPERY